MPAELSAAMERLAEVIRLLGQEHEIMGHSSRPVTRHWTRLAGRARGKGLKSYGDALVIQLRTTASDMLRATGHDPDTANRMAGEQVGR